MENKFTWGNSVRVKPIAPSKFYPNNLGEVIDLFEIENEKEKEKFMTDIGEFIYTIEFSDGSMINIPENYLELLEK